MVGCTDKGVIKRLLLGSISQRMARYSKTRSGQYGKNAVVPDILRLLEPLNKINTNNSMC
jgi:hypothetical protein